MDSHLEQIAELFALPGLMAEEDGEITLVKQGKSSQESQTLGEQALNDGDHTNAIRHFQNAINQAQGQEVGAKFGLASAYEYADRVSEAYRGYLLSLKQGAQGQEPRMAISDLMKRHGRFREAVEQLQSAIEKDPENAFLHFKLAETLREMGERGQALGAIISAIQFSENDAFYHYWLGDLLIEMDRPGEALQSLRMAIELSPGDDYLYLRSAVAFWLEGRTTDAIKAVRLASDLDPAKHLYHGLLESLLYETGQEAEAEMESERADKMDRFDEDMLARILREMRISEG